MGLFSSKHLSIIPIEAEKKSEQSSSDGVGNKEEKPEQAADSEVKVDAVNQEEIDQVKIQYCTTCI